MIFNTHYDLEGQHAFLGASKYHWINYDEEKITSSYLKYQSIKRGTVLHDFACQCILLGERLQKSKKTLNMYVNDAIGYKMTPEQMLYYSDNCFGTADAICFRQNLLRIHDFKSGESPTSMKQLEIYTALFCLEYDIHPENIGIELRIYQSNEVLIHEPAIDDILRIMDKMILFDKRINKIKAEGE